MLEASARLSLAMLEAARDQARDATLQQGVVVQGVALLMAAVRGDEDARRHAEGRLHDTLRLVARVPAEDAS